MLFNSVVVLALAATSEALSVRAIENSGLYRRAAFPQNGGNNGGGQNGGGQNGGGQNGGGQNGGQNGGNQGGGGGGNCSCNYYANVLLSALLTCYRSEPCCSTDRQCLYWSGSTSRWTSSFSDVRTIP